jgi:hypothetical protein
MGRKTLVDGIGKALRHFPGFQSFVAEEAQYLGALLSPSISRGPRDRTQWKYWFLQKLRAFDGELRILSPGKGDQAIDFLQDLEPKIVVASIR